VPTSQTFVALLYCRTLDIFKGMMESDVSCSVDTPPRHLEGYPEEMVESGRCASLGRVMVGGLGTWYIRTF
jgi:hypothetical protein